jgi:hypothetical protein
MPSEMSDWPPKLGGLGSCRQSTEIGKEIRERQQKLQGSAGSDEPPPTSF